MNNLSKRLDDLRALIQEPDFLEGRGLSNEVNIRIFCYDAKDEMVVRAFIEKLTTDQNLNCRLIEHNLYRVFLSICDGGSTTGSIMDRIAPLEKQKGKRFVLDQLKSVASNVAFVDKMRLEPCKRGDVILITGVGEAFPFIRIHSLLDAMQPYFSDVPVLVMYPGSFDGRYVRLFDRLTPNPYYRAFNVIQDKDAL